MDNSVPAYQQSDAPGASFAEIEIGRSLGTLEWIVQPENVRGLMHSDADFHEWYLTESPFGPPIVPPLATYPPVRLLFTRTYNVRGMFIEFTSRFMLPIYYDRKYIISGKIEDKWVKREREYVRYSALCVDDDGNSVFTTERTHILDFKKRSDDTGSTS